MCPEKPMVLARMVSEKVEQVVLEVTSHALVQERVGACDFDTVAVTYVGRDHLDYHPSWEEYVAAKARLIDLCAAGAQKGTPKTAILNLDDASLELLSSRPIERRWTYSLKGPADIMAKGLHCAEVCTFRLVTAEGEAPVELALPARFDVYNALNGNPVLAFNTTYGPNWLVPQIVLPARFFKLSARISF